MAPSKTNSKKAKVEDKQKTSIATKAKAEPVVAAVAKKSAEESSSTKKNSITTAPTGKSKILNLQIVHRGG